ncbi:MAG: MFS transporter [Vicinamibacterales bacterium]
MPSASAAAGVAPAASSPSSSASPVPFNRRLIGLLAFGHGANDLYQSAMPALLPYLVAQHGLSYTAASGIVLAATAVSSIVQPALGWLADRRPMGWSAPAGVAAAGIGLALAAGAPSYGWVIACVLLSGLGVATFHPESLRFANYAAGHRRATGISIFAVGGNAGFSLGPIVMGALLSLWGPRGAVWIALPGLAAALALWRAMPRLEALRQSAAARRSALGVDNWSAFLRLTTVVTLRSATNFSLMAFIPLYFVHVRAESTQRANAMLSLMLVSGAIAAFFAGRLADSFGRRPVIVWSMALAGAVVFALPAASGVLAAAVIVAIGTAMGGSFSPAIVLGQEYLPTRVGVASGITVGLAIGLGGTAAPIFGRIADVQGLEAALRAIAVVPVLGAAIAWTLPPSSRGD